MPSFLTDSEKSAMQSVFQDLHDTFARPIYYYKEAKKVVLSTNPKFNSIYQQNIAPKKTVQRIVQSGSFNARIQYDTDRSEATFEDPSVDSQLKIKMPDGYVRIKVDSDGHEILKSAKRLEFDERRFSVESDVRPHGLFTPNYYTYFLLPTS
jgi:hypothetical protein